jgi:hypothetical protein
MSDMTEGEALERFTEGLKKAASKAREIGAATGLLLWNDIARTLDELRENGTKLSQMTALSRFDVLAMLDERQKTLAVPNEAVN